MELWDAKVNSVENVSSSLFFGEKFETSENVLSFNPESIMHGLIYDRTDEDFLFHPPRNEKIESNR